MINNEIIECPVCRDTLTVKGHSYICINKHTFDIASKGYVNLLLSHDKSSKKPGDNKQMVVARNAFLNTGHFQKLAEAINSVVVEYVQSRERGTYLNILDAGCGEGYYTDALQKGLMNEHIEVNLYGMDISKDAIRLAAARNKHILFAIASSFQIPIAPNTINCLLQLFSPCSDNEFHRVMKDDGILISVIPGKNHLFGLKKVLYENPYVNDEQEYPLLSFDPISKVHIQYDITIENTETIKNLIMMTPYYWRTKPQKINKLLEVTKLETPLEFVLTVYTKK